MPNLVLTGTHLHPYQNNLACAYIYYGSKEAPTDHKDKPISLFGDFPNELIEHLKSKVMPKLTKHLSAHSSSYKAIDVDVVNQAPHPFIIIQRKDGKMISPDEVHKISHDLMKILSAINHHSSKHNHTLFSNKMNKKNRRGIKEHTTEHAAKYLSAKHQP